MATAIPHTRGVVVATEDNSQGDRTMTSRYSGSKCGAAVCELGGTIIAGQEIVKAPTDDTLARMASELASAMDAAGLTRRRAGVARGIYWLEAAGRSKSGGWLEMRLHHRPKNRRVDGAIVEYQPIALGGRTVPLGQLAVGYVDTSDEAADAVISAARTWLGELA